MTLNDHKAMLDGIRIVDMSSVVFGPYATQILSDLGAEVIKVEPPGGDDYRQASAPAVTPKMAPEFMAINRNKKSVILDLKKPDDSALMRDLLKTADIFLHNIRAQAVERLGLGYQTVRGYNPEIIYVHCRGYGANGPYSDFPAYDDAVQAASGATTLLPRVDGNPKPRFLPSLLADKTAGLHAAYTTLAAIIHKLRTGKGQAIEVSLFESFTSFILKEHLSGHAFEPKRGTIGYDRQINPDRQPFPTKDGYITIVPYRPEQWPVVFALLGDPDFFKHPDFADMRGIRKNGFKLYQRLAELTALQTTAALAEKLQGNDIPAQAAKDLNDVFDDPHLQAVGFFEKSQHPTEGTFYHIREAAKFSAWEVPACRPAPLLGEHTKDIHSMIHGRTNG